MTTLDESAIIRMFQDSLGNKGFVSEDVETFAIGRTRLIAKVDTLVQSTDIPPKMSLADAARKSVVACVSDFASKGARPEFGMISISIPRQTSPTKIKEISRGFAAAAREFRIKIIGGDTNEGEEIVFHVCIFGAAKKIVKRKGASEGDMIFVTGPFGYTAAGLEILMRNRKGQKQFTKKSLQSVFHPRPRLEFGLECRKYLSSSMDSSDGLSTTLNEMSRQSKKRFIIDDMPTGNDLIDFANRNKIDPAKLVFHGGEEYEFVFTAKKKHRHAIAKISQRHRTPIIEIGHVASGGGVYTKRDTVLTSLKDFGWHHFR